MKPTRRLRVRWFAAAAVTVVAVVVLLNGARIADGIAGWWIGRQLSEAVEAVPTDTVVDLAEINDTDWERVVWVHPYSLGDYGNELLGFGYFDRNEVLASDDTVSRLLFVKGDDVLDDVGLHRLSFDDDVTGFARDQARFVVTRDSLGVTLMRPEVQAP